VLRLQAENDQLAQAAVDHGRLSLDDAVPEPALT
jgi:hypothetical protein